MGFTNYWARFIPNSAAITETLRKLTRNEVDFEWSEATKSEFPKLKVACVNPKTLNWADRWRKPGQLWSSAQIAAIVGINTVAYASRALIPVEMKYPQKDRGALAIFWAKKYFRPYTLGWEFTDLIDHKPLVPLINKPTANFGALDAPSSWRMLNACWRRQQAWFK